MRNSLSIMARSSANDGSEDVTEYEKKAMILYGERSDEQWPW